MSEEQGELQDKIYGLLTQLRKVTSALSYGNFAFYLFLLKVAPSLD